MSRSLIMLGSIHPSTWTFQLDWPIDNASRGMSPVGLMHIQAEAGRIVATCEIDDDVRPTHVRNSLEPMLLGWIGAWAVANDRGCEFRFTHYDIGAGPVEFQEAVTPTPNTEVRGEVLALHSLGNGVVRSALSDYVDAIRRPMDTIFHCYRSLDALRSLFPGTQKEQWEAVHEALGTSKEFFAPLIDRATSRRHGETVGDMFAADRALLTALEVTQAERREALAILKVTLGRLAEWLSRGKTPLPRSEFPVLTHQTLTP